MHPGQFKPDQRPFFQLLLDQANRQDGQPQTAFRRPNQRLGVNAHPLRVKGDALMKQRPFEQIANRAARLAQQQPSGGKLSDTQPAFSGQRMVRRAQYRDLIIANGLLDQPAVGKLPLYEPVHDRLTDAGYAPRCRFALAPQTPASADKKPPSAPAKRRWRR